MGLPLAVYPGTYTPGAETALHAAVDVINETWAQGNAKLAVFEAKIDALTDESTGWLSTTSAPQVGTATAVAAPVVVEPTVTIPTEISTANVIADYEAEYTKIRALMVGDLTKIFTDYFPEDSATYTSAETWIQAAIDNPSGGLPATVAAQAPYPCVVKPLNLNGSRGVMRADSPEELIAAIARLTRLIAPGSQAPSPQPSPAGRGGAEPSPQPSAAGRGRPDPLPNPLPEGEGAGTRSPAPQPPPAPYLIEAYIPGVEVALEGLLDDGRLRVLALFDKPDPLDGPFFEETIYVTPSRLPAATQAAIAQATADAARALGLRVGPVHAELRVNDAGPWIVEVAGRSIGGLCSQVLRFGVDASLEELILRQAVGLPLGDVGRRDRAAGVMMIPIPAAGLMRKVDGVEAAAAVPLVTAVEITAPLHYPLTPLPEGDSYLGFIFARGETPAAVEAALRAAHSELKFTIEPLLPVVS